MNKKYIVWGSVIGIVVIVIAVLAVFNPLNFGALDKNTSVTRRGASELLAVTIMVDLIKYYNVETNSLDFSQSPVAKEQVATEISSIKAKYGGDYDYKIFEVSERGLSIKTVEKTSGAYYCIDTNTRTPVEIKKDQFTLNTDCAGNRL